MEATKHKERERKKKHAQAFEVAQGKFLFVFVEEIKLKEHCDETAENLKEQQRNFKWRYLEMLITRKRLPCLCRYVTVPADRLLHRIYGVTK